MPTSHRRMWSGSAHTAVAHGTTVAMASAKSVVFVRMHGRGSFQPSTCQKHQKTRMYLWRSMKWWKIWIPSSTSQVWQWQLFISNLATPRRQEHQLKIFSRFLKRLDWMDWNIFFGDFQIGTPTNVFERQVDKFIIFSLGFTLQFLFRRFTRVADARTVFAVGTKAPWI